MTDPTPTYAPGDFVVILDCQAPYALGLVTETVDCGAEGIYYWTAVPGRAPHPYTAAEVRPATQEDRAAHHPTWLRCLAEDWTRRQRIEADLACTEHGEGATS